TASAVPDRARGRTPDRRERPGNCRAFSVPGCQARASVVAVELFPPRGIGLLHQALDPARGIDGRLDRVPQRRGLRLWKRLVPVGWRRAPRAAQQRGEQGGEAGAHRRLPEGVRYILRPYMHWSTTWIPTAGAWTGSSPW